MRTSERLRLAAQPFADGEQIREAIPAQTFSPLWTGASVGIAVLVSTQFFEPDQLSSFLIAVLVAGLLAAAGPLLLTATGNRFRIIVVTDQRVLFLAAGRVSYSRGNSLLAVQPGGIPITLRRGLMWTVVAGLANGKPESLYVHRRYHSALEATCAVASGHSTHQVNGGSLDAHSGP